MKNNTNVFYMSFCFVLIALLIVYLPYAGAENISNNLDFPAGWSMISLPVIPVNAYVSSLFPGAVVIYGYKKGIGYVRVADNEELESGKGYWILLDQNQAYSVNGTIFQSYNQTISEDGWLMIGGCTCPAKASVQNGNIEVIYGYVRGIGYKRILESEYLEPSKGYWILLSNTDNKTLLIVDGSGGPIVCTDFDEDGFAIESGLCGPRDCNDTDPNINPDANEICNNIDDNCNALTDEGFDSDGDNITTCGGDCDDNNASIFPGASEICEDGIDQDCNGKDSICCTDTDGDGFSIEGSTCGPQDCDDNDPNINPGIAEICEDNTDQDCSGEDLPCVLNDADGDLWSVGQGDCDDNNPAVFPGATDFPENGIDENCDGKDAPSPHLADLDFDGYTAESGDCHDQNPGAYPGATEIQCNGIDEDCNGSDLCYLTPTIVEKSGFIDGEVFDARTEAPLESATIKMANVGQMMTDANGKFSFPTPKEGFYLILIEKEGYTYAQRRIHVQSGYDFAVEPIYLVPIDPVTVTITPEDGGTLINSTGDVELHFEVNSVTEAVNVSATRLYDNRELPGDLPPTSHFTTAVKLTPDGLTLEKPTRILVENSLGFAPGTPVPVGYYRKDLGRWVPDGMGVITEDGKYMEYFVVHFSSYDLNYGSRPSSSSEALKKIPVKNTSRKKNNPASSDKDGKGGCKVIYKDGELIEDYHLPAYNSIGASHTVSLFYRSNSADPKAMISLEYEMDSNQVALIEKVEFKVNIGGINTSRVFLPKNDNISFRYLFDGTNFRGEKLPSGGFPYLIELINWCPAYYNAAPWFASQSGGLVLDSLGNPIRAPRDFPLKREFKGKISIDNRINSPIGAGWSIAELQRIYGNSYDNYVTLVSGSGEKLYFDTGGTIKTYVKDFQGPITQETFNTPNGIAADAEGNLYIADSNNQRIVRVDPTGVVSIIAGTGTIGYSGDGGPATQASIFYPWGIAVDRAGNIYFSDYGNHSIRRINPAGIITTIAGTGTAGYSGDGGLATQASFNSPTGISVDAAGNVYIADRENDRVRRIDPAGIITTYAGNGIRGYSGDGGPATQASLNRPFNAETDAAGNLYISDRDNSCIRRVDTSTGIITTIAGTGIRGYSGDGGPATQACLRNPCGVEVDGSYIYIADFSNNRIRRVDPNGIITTIAGTGTRGYSGDGGPPTEADLDWPRMVKIDGAGNLYIADLINHCIRIIKDIGFGIRTSELSSPEGDYSKLTRHDDGTYTRIMKDGTTYQFNAKGLQTSKTDTNGRTTTYAYDANDRLASITDPADLVTAFTYNGHNLASISDPAGRTTQFSHDADNNLIKIIAPDGSNTNFTYDNQHLMTSKTDPLGRTTQFNYNIHGMVNSVVWPDEGIDQYAPSDGSGLINDLPENIGTYRNPVSVQLPHDDLYTDPEGNMTHMKTDKYGRLLSKTDALNNVTTYERDTESGNVTKIHTPDGATVQKGYDDKGNLLFYTDREGNTTIYTYESTFNKVKTITDPLGRVTTFNYDTKGNPVKVTNPIGHTTTMTYYSNGLVHTITNANGATTTYEYDSFGNMIKKTDALGNVTSYTYDAAGNIISVTDSLGHITTYAYDAMNNLTNLIDPEGGQISFTYDAMGNRISMTNANGNTTQYQYDSKDRLVKIIDPLGNEITYTYDNNDNILTSMDAKGATTAYEYDALNRLIKETDPLGNQTTYTYDAMGNRISMTNAKGNTFYYEYDLENRMIKTIDPLNGQTTFVYDGNGNLLAITDAKGQTTTFSYDNLNRKVSMTNPLGEQEFYTYDKNGNLIQKTLYNSDKINYEYDSLDRMTKKILADGSMTTYSYDQVDNIIGITNPFSSLSFSYDNNNRPITARTAASAYQPQTTITYTYDSNGNRLSITDPYGSVTNYTYNELDSPTTITDPNGQTTSFTYDQNNRRTSKTLPNNLSSLYSYNSNGDLSSLNHNLDSFTISGYSYEYDAVGNRTKMTDLDGDHDYIYDKLNQLLQAAHPSIDTETFTYDTAGNRLSSALTSGWSYDTGNRLLDDGDFTYQYTNGCLTRKTNKSTGQATNYTYNSENRLIGINTSNNNIFYYYDGLGRRICKEVNGVKTYYIYDDEDIIFILNGSFNISSRYTHGLGIDEPIQMEQGDISYYYLFDALGSIVQVLDIYGNTQQEYTYDSFGNIVDQTSALNNPYTYTGREYDPESGLYYYRARYYDPKIGRFLTPDPIGFAGGDINLYRYVGNNPVNFVDALGLCKKPCKDDGRPLLSPKDETTERGNITSPKEILNNPAYWLDPSPKNQLPSDNEWITRDPSGNIIDEIGINRNPMVDPIPMISTMGAGLIWGAATGIATSISHKIVRGITIRTVTIAGGSIIDKTAPDHIHLPSPSFRRPQSGGVISAPHSPDPRFY
ncbi:MAG: MopE-related protein [bacterium]